MCVSVCLYVLYAEDAGLGGGFFFLQLSMSKQISDGKDNRGVYDEHPVQLLAKICKISSNTKFSLAEHSHLCALLVHDPVQPDKNITHVVFWSQLTNQSASKSLLYSPLGRSVFHHNNG